MKCSVHSKDNLDCFFYFGYRHMEMPPMYVYERWIQIQVYSLRGIQWYVDLFNYNILYYIVTNKLHALYKELLIFKDGSLIYSVILIHYLEYKCCYTALSTF